MDDVSSKGEVSCKYAQIVMVVLEDIEGLVGAL